ncbi:MAG: Acg family FMN-binding oxidoreductase [Planctomycetia bacterium]
MNDMTLALIEQAVRAPSSHNTQPWLFRIHKGAVEIHADRSRALPVNGPHDRELHISCGAALFNLEVAAARAGVGTETTRLPDPSNPSHLATVSFGGEPDAALAELADVIPTRRSTREAFEERPLPADLGAELVALADRHEDCHVALAETATRREDIARLVADGDKAQFDNSDWRSELAHWMRPRSAGDGLTTPRLVGPVMRAVIRNLDLGRFVAGADERLARDAPILAVLWSDGDEPRAWLETGRLLEKAALRAGLADVQAGFLNQPCEVAELRPRLREALGIRGFPQLVVRFGHAPAVDELKPRRPVGDVVLGDAGSVG